MLSVPEASARILTDIPRLSSERVPLRDALGRVLATEVRSPVTLPAWDNSAMDGYAVRGADIDGATSDRPVTLLVLETVAAGQFPTRPLGPGEATRIMTGAPLPTGADTVIRVEDTDGGTGTVAVRNARDARRNIRPRGEDMHEGDAVLVAGTPLAAAQLGVLASMGQKSVEVYRRPRVAFLGSGDELVDIDRFDEVRQGTKIVSSNSYTLHALIRSAGGEPVDLGVVADTASALRERLENADECDLLVTSAGISVGEFDYTRQVMESLGATMRFWKVRMRPGAPLGFGLLPQYTAGRQADSDETVSRWRPWIGLPGNPVSVMVTFELFVRPALRRMLGHERLFRRPVSVTLEEPVTIGARLTHFLRAIVTPRPDGTITARLTGPQGSGILTSMAAANALLVVPEDRPRAEAGEVLHALQLSEDAQLSTEFQL